MPYLMYRSSGASISSNHAYSSSFPSINSSPLPVIPIKNSTTITNSQNQVTDYAQLTKTGVGVISVISTFSSGIFFIRRCENVKYSTRGYGSEAMEVPSCFWIKTEVLHGAGRTLSTDNFANLTTTWIPSTLCIFALKLNVLNIGTEMIFSVELIMFLIIMEELESDLELEQFPLNPWWVVVQLCYVVSKTWIKL